MENSLNELLSIKEVEPSINLETKIWQAILCKKENTISNYNIAVAACFLGVLFFAEIELANKIVKDKTADLKGTFHLTTQYNFYHE